MMSLSALVALYSNYKKMHQLFHKTEFFFLFVFFGSLFFIAGFVFIVN